MHTKRITSLADAARIIREGGLVAFPTETVFGLGVDATNSAAVERLFVAKGRPSDNPLIVHIGLFDQWPQAASAMTSTAEALLKAFAPGPLTVVLPKHPSISPLVSAQLETVGIRIPDHPVAREILRQANVPVAAPSANRSGRPSGTTWEAVLEDLDGRIEGIYCQNSDSIGIESTVVDCCGPIPTVLRPGAVTIDRIREVVPQIRELQTGRPESSSASVGKVSSPGLLHPHYQPRATVRLVADPASLPNVAGIDVAYCGMKQFAEVDELGLSTVFETLEEYAAGFYEFLREVDRRRISMVYIQEAPDRGIGTALRDRQRRAAGG